ncbi:hypothetical protein IEQ34_010357 [Dendrobium chrysotoxum]|uniref:Uncharacterized protein n=1 Tax=Dendrobium chrysotoxum TaxID=161865 RepID=A0AAV7H4I9_DENCH|nr:hypothetical protein IEQ34_010357 [Dendrobium chrysotoxum]
MLRAVPWMEDTCLMWLGGRGKDCTSWNNQEVVFMWGGPPGLVEPFGAIETTGLGRVGSIEVSRTDSMGWTGLVWAGKAGLGRFDRTIINNNTLKAISYPLSQSNLVTLTIFDYTAFDIHVPALYAFLPPTPSNKSLKFGLSPVFSSPTSLTTSLRLELPAIHSPK